MKKLSKFSYSLAAAFEGGAWFGAVFVAVMILGLLSMAGNYLGEAANGPVYVGGDFLTEADLKNFQNIAVCVLPFFLMEGICTALIFRNLRLILKGLRAKSGEGFSAENSPFSENVVRRVRRIGWLALGTAGFRTLAGLFMWLAFPGKPVIMLGVSDIIFSVLVFYLSKIFEYGIHLQKETEGLV